MKGQPIYEWGLITYWSLHIYRCFCTYCFHSLPPVLFSSVPFLIPPVLHTISFPAVDPYIGVKVRAVRFTVTRAQQQHHLIATTTTTTTTMTEQAQNPRPNLLIRPPYRWWEAAIVRPCPLSRNLQCATYRSPIPSAIFNHRLPPPCL